LPTSISSSSPGEPRLDKWTLSLPIGSPPGLSSGPLPPPVSKSLSLSDKSPKEGSSIPSLFRFLLVTITPTNATATHARTIPATAPEEIGSNVEFPLSGFLPGLVVAPVEGCIEGWNWNVGEGVSVVDAVGFIVVGPSPEVGSNVVATVGNGSDVGFIVVGTSTNKLGDKVGFPVTVGSFVVGRSVVKEGAFVSGTIIGALVGDIITGAVVVITGAVETGASVVGVGATTGEVDGDTGISVGFFDGDNVVGSIVGFSVGDTDGWTVTGASVVGRLLVIGISVGATTTTGANVILIGLFVGTPSRSAKFTLA